MRQYCSVDKFYWVKNIHKIEQRLMNIKNNSSTGYVLEVDLEYPQELHDIHNDYPLAPEKINIPKEWLSDYCLKIASVHNITTGTVKKLVPNLMNKNNYVIHYRNLQQCLELGMKLKKIHRVLKFKQKDWMKPYIDFYTQKRKEATNEVDKNHFKLLNNDVHGHNSFIEFQEFYDTLFKKKILRHTMRRIGSKNHNLGTYETNKDLYHVLMMNDIFSKMELIH